MVTVAAYLRRSIDSQEHSLGMQKTQAKEEAAKRNLVIDEYYIDNAVSARKTNTDERKELNRLIGDIESEKVTTLFVYKRDRIARNVEQYMEIYELFKRKNLNVIFTAENEISLQYTPAGEFFELVMAGFNQKEGEQINQRIRETKNAMSIEGELYAGNASYGYFVKDKLLIPDKNKASDIELIFKEFVENDFKSFAAFVSHINRIGIKYKVDQIEKEWTDGNLRDLIHRSIYKGIRFTFDSKGNKTEHFVEKVKIVDESVWEQANQKYQLQYSRKKSLEVTEKVVMDFLLDGLIVCVKCGSNVNGKVVQDRDGVSHGVYQCSQHNKYKIEKEVLEKIIFKGAKAVFQEIGNVRGKKIIIQDFINYKEDYEKKIHSLEIEINRFENDLASLSKDWLNNKNNERLRISMFKKLSNINNLKEELSKYKYSLYFLKKYPIEEKFEYYKSNFHIEKLNTETQIELIKDVVNKIYLGQGTMNKVEFKFPLDVVTNMYAHAII